MIIRPKGSVIIPRHPLAVGGLLGWAREINKTIQQLRDRVFEVPIGRGGGSSAATGRLVLVSAMTTDDPPAPGFSVTNGYVNDQIPTLDTVSLDDDPAPVQEITGSKAVWIKVVGTFGTPDTYVITIETSANTSTLPTANDISPTGFTFSKLLGTVALDGSAGVVTPIYEGGDIACESLGTMIHWWIVTV